MKINATFLELETGAGIALHSLMPGLREAVQGSGRVRTLKSVKTWIPVCTGMTAEEKSLDPRFRGDDAPKATGFPPQPALDSDRGRE